MKWSDFVREVSERSGVHETEVRKLLAATREVLSDSLFTGDAVRWPGVGTFSSRWREARVLRGPSGRRRMLVGGRHTLNFRAAAALKDRLLDRSKQHWRSPSHQQAWRLAETLVSDLALYHQESIPTGLDPQADDDGVHASCAASFGAMWAQVRNTYTHQIDRSVIASDHDYLAFVARRRWAGIGS